MHLFPPPMLGAAYQDARKTAVDWITKTCECSDANAKQVITSIENHDGTEGGGGITDITVTITSGTGRGQKYRAFHHSHGQEDTTTCTVFWIVQPAQVQGTSIAKIVALGRHRGPDTYIIDWLAGAGFTFGREGGVGPKAAIPTKGATIYPFKVAKK